MTEVALPAAGPRASRPPTWELLTQQARKVELYATEPLLWEAWESFCATWGADVEEVLQRLAVLVLKPEAVKRGCVRAVVDSVALRGFTPIAWRSLDYSPAVCHHVWRYQWNKATVDRSRLHTYIGTQTPWLLVVLRDDDPQPDIPASVRLWELKGSTKPELRDEHRLRSLVCMSNRMIGFMHATDEPLDIVREHGILFDEQTRSSWLAELDANLERDLTHPALEAAAMLEATTARHSVDIDEVIARLGRAETPAAVADLVSMVGSGSRTRLADVRAAFGELADDESKWDYIVLAAELIEHDRDGVEATLDAAALPIVKQRWSQQSGRARRRQRRRMTQPASVLVVDPVHPDALDALAERYRLRVQLRPSAEELSRMIEDVDVIVLRSGVKLTAPIIAAARKLKLIARAGVGVENIDLDSARARRIPVFNVPAESSTTTAEFTFGLLLAVARKIALADRQMRENLWRKGDLYGMELAGKTLGVLGLGRIGTRVAAIAQGFGMSVVGCVANPTPARRDALARMAIRVDELETVLAESDAITVHVPFTEATKGLIAAAQLELMRPTAYLVDVSRGGVVDEQDLLDALRERKIAGAAKDVFVAEGARTRLAELDNAVLTPHIGAMTDDSQQRIAHKLVDAIAVGLAGGEIPNRVC